MKKNILKSNSSFVVIGASPAYSLQTESGRIFSLAQAVNFDFSSNKQASKQLGYQNYSSNIDYVTPQVNLSIDYYFSPYLNNELLMGFRNSGDGGAMAISGFKNKNHNFYFFSNENDGADGFDELGKSVGNQNWSESEVICFGNCYLDSYSLSMALGQIPVVSTKFKSSNITSLSLANSGGGTRVNIPTPDLRPIDGKESARNFSYTSNVEITGGNIDRDIEGRNDLNPPVAVPHRSLVSILSKNINDTGVTPLRNFSNLILQSCSLNFNFNRVDLYKFGNNSVCDRKLQFPINATIQIESLVSGFNANYAMTQTGSGSAILNNKENLYDVSFAFSNEQDYVTGFYNFQEAKLTSLNYTTQLNNIYRMSASFSVEITESKGFLINRNSLSSYSYFKSNPNFWQSESNNWDFS
jgi:hypothetical protein